MEYDLVARKRLGREVRRARVQAGHANRGTFADKIGRSARQVQALENGESGVGPDTWAAAAEELGWPLARVYELLDGTATGGTPSPLAIVSDEELAAEVLRRMKGVAGGDTAAIAVGPKPASGGLSVVDDSLTDAVAAHEEEGSIAGEQEESDTP